MAMKEDEEECGFKKLPLRFIEGAGHVTAIKGLKDRMAYWKKKLGRDILYSLDQDALFYLEG